MQGESQSVLRPVAWVRSPLPLLAIGIVVAALVIVLVTLASRQAQPDASKTPAISDSEAISIVAHEMRSGAAAARVSAQGTAEFGDGAWTITVDDAQFHFTQRNRIVTAENAAARQLEFGDDGSGG